MLKSDSRLSYIYIYIYISREELSLLLAYDPSTLRPVCTSVRIFYILFPLFGEQKTDRKFFYNTFIYCNNGAVFNYLLSKIITS